jgi:hypothetical protein
VSFGISLPSSFPRASEIHYPPYEQVLVGVGVGAMGLVQASSCIIIQLVWCTHYPPNEQWLISMGVGTPSSSARSVGGWAWCGESSSLAITIAMNHPTSRSS